jgi:hypothetical protein
MDRVGLTEIADYYAIRKQLADKWSRHSAFPAPVEQLARGRVWDMEQVIAWGVAHGRSKGCGPLPERPGPTSSG